MASENVNVRMDAKLIAYIDSFISPNGTYESRSEFIRDLIRKNMALSFPAETKEDIKEGLLEGYQDILAGRVIKSTGNIREDLRLFREREQQG